MSFSMYTMSFWSVYNKSLIHTYLFLCNSSIHYINIIFRNSNEYVIPKWEYPYIIKNITVTLIKGHVQHPPGVLSYTLYNTLGVLYFNMQMSTPKGVTQHLNFNSVYTYHIHTHIYIETIFSFYPQVWGSFTLAPIIAPLIQPYPNFV